MFFLAAASSADKSGLRKMLGCAKHGGIALDGDYNAKKVFDMSSKRTMGRCNDMKGAGGKRVLVMLLSKTTSRNAHVTILWYLNEIADL
jgi:hypothetical protein